MYCPMANKPESPAKNLAHNLQAARAMRGLTQGQLAASAGIPRSTVTNLESGGGNPSLATLVRLAEALSFSIEELLARPRAFCALSRAGELKSKTYDDGRVRITKLLPEPLQGLEIDHMELAPGGWKQGVPHMAGSREFLACAFGAVSVYVAGETYALAAGDVLAFPGDQAHSYRNPHAAASGCYSVVTLAPRPARRG
jgi:transcriptional regulator with XRE-family HTH domain